MKSYVFFCRGYAGVGGEQLYIRNKIEYLKSNDWDVKIFSYRTGPIYVKELELFTDGINNKLFIPPFLYSKTVSEQILAWILSLITKSDQYVIESDSVLISYWGEMLAKRVKGVHLLFLVDEKPIIPKFCRDYLSFKFNRHEFACITVKTLQYAFPNIDIKTPNDYKLLAFCMNSIDDVNDSNIEIPLGNGVKIGILGRLDKPYVKPITVKIIEYAQKHPDLFFEIVYIGGALSENVQKRISKMFFKSKNAKVHITGFVSPIPRSFMDKFDFFIGTAGAALATYREGYLTIAIDSFKLKANGIVGIHTVNTLSTVPIQYELEELFDDIIYRKKYRKNQMERQPLHNLDYYFAPHLDYILNNLEKKSYFDMDMIKLSPKYRLLKYVIKFIGVNNSMCFLSLARKLKIQNLITSMSIQNR